MQVRQVAWTGFRLPWRRRRPGRVEHREDGARSGGVLHGDGHHLDIELTNGTRVCLPHEYAEAGWVDHGYASTIHKAQGLTADKTILLADDSLAREHTYVALSRGRQSNRIIVALTDAFNEHENSARPPSPADRLTPLLNRSAAQEMAIEL